ncbi:MAG TPA: glycosyltransferase family 2 protein [Symbiobacteriaceae bacterium]|nr:glycosyltransferase family 2 protein [Symbiobacteriaceae bacterium]
MVEKVDETQVTWFRGLKGTDRQTMRERAALLDRLSATERPDRSVRLALFVGEAEEALSETATLAYTLAAAGQVIWLYTSGALPAEVPADFHERVRHINPDPDRPLVEQVPPADLFLTPDPGLLAMFYRAERTLLYWHRPGTALSDGWAALPARILTAGAAGTTLDGRRVFPVAPGAEGWAIALAAALKVATKDPLRARRPRLSLCMIVKNEERYLQNCLLSVYGVVDEICIVDTGSSDQTVAIAERLGARVEHRVWRDDFAWARNESLAMATGDWVLHLDADEVLTPEARVEIPQLIQQGGYNGFLLPIESVLASGATSRSYVLRLFQRRREIYFTGAIHEHVGNSLTALNGKVLATAALIRHFGYMEDPMRATGKRSRNRELLLRCLIAEPGHPRYLYYLAVEEYLSGNAPEALRLLSEVPLDAGWVEGEPVLLAFNAHRVMGNIRGALAAVLRGTVAYPTSAVLWVNQAELAYALGEQGALSAAVAKLGDPSKLLGDPHYAKSHLAYLLAGQSMEPEVKERHLQKALPSNVAARALMRHWVRTYGLSEAIRRTGELALPDGFALLAQALSDLQDWPHLQMLLTTLPALRAAPAAGSLFLAQGRPEEALVCWQNAGAEGWRRYAVTVALLGGGQMVAAAEPHVTPLEWLAVQDVLANRSSWRWAVLVSALCNINNPMLLELVLSRAPQLAEAITHHMRLNVLS